jgi:signal transduction histidine kinase
MSQPTRAGTADVDQPGSEARFRRQLADRMHDQLQQLLSAARMKAGLVRRQSADAATVEALREVERLLEQAMSESAALIGRLKDAPDPISAAEESHPHS